MITHIRSVIVDGSVVCAYVPTRTEPGSTDLLDAVAEIAQRVLLPITGEPGPLSWVEYSGANGLRPAKYGIREPVGPVLPPESPVRRGMHADPCSRGGSSRNTPRPCAGFYDRTLGSVGPQTRLVAIVRDSELVEALPADDHDIPMGWALTPSGGLTPLQGD